MINLQLIHAYVHILSISVRFDYSLASAGIVTFTPGGPNEHTIQLSVDKDELLELNETYLLALHLSDESIDAGAQVGAINQTRVTIINDDSKIQHRHIAMAVCTTNIFQKFKFFLGRSLLKLENLRKPLSQLDSAHRRQPYLLRLE